MCVPQGIITVVDESPEQEDEALTTLRGLTKFEPLIVPEQPSHFSLASVFGALSTAAGPKSASFDLTFNPAVLVDILVQINAHNKKCAQDIQGFQRSLALKMKGLDEYTYTAVKDLGNVQQEAKSQSDHLLSVHALVRQANTTTELLHEIVQKIQGIAATLPADADAEVPSPEKYPNLYRYLQQTPTSPTVNRKSMEANAGSGPSGLALLGHGPTIRTRQSNTQQYPTRTSALSVPKARASMALASSALSFLPMFSNSAPDTSQLASLSLGDTSSSGQIAKGGSVEQGEDRTPSRPRTPQGTTQKASDNLRRLATKAPLSSSVPTSHDHSR